MARLVVLSDRSHAQVIELKLGLNRLGRSSENDFQIEHPTISSRHCEITLGDEAVSVRDCDSTNGTFLNGEPIREAQLRAGQTLQLGDVELLVETTDVTIAIPRFEQPIAAPPIVLTDGKLVCPRHAQVLVTHQCTFCRELMCDACVHSLRRRGGKLLKLCPICSHVVERIGGVKKPKRSLLEFLRSTVRLPFLHHSKRADD